MPPAPIPPPPTAYGKVEWCLKHDPRCRNSDRWLYRQVCSVFYGLGGGTTLDEWADQQLPGYSGAVCADYETCRRDRAKIQNEEGRWLATDPQVRTRRKQHEVKRRGDLGYPS